MNKIISEHIIKVHNIFKEKKITLSIAESCTGGLISHYITSFPGSSEFFVAGLVVYSAEMKKKILRIPSRIIENFGVVSSQTAIEMADRIRKLTSTDFSVSTTGNLGPDVLEGKERGLIYIAVSRKNHTSVKEHKFKGNRQQNKEKAALKALEFLIETVSS
ncbi:MAG: CinA family protein [Nitrospirae bacterium]|jgi:PncC family amidohydrolase|nr:CinA family protein [Nitrospirota bacterium]